MPSRMERYEKYYEAKEDGPSRTKKNQELYNQIYEENDFEEKDYMAKDYTNVSGFANAPGDSTINIQKIRDMINERENKNKKIESINEEIPVENTAVEEVAEDEKNHDINDVLNKAKDERTASEEQNEYHSLKNVELSILKNLKIDGKKDDTVNEEVLSDNKDELPELINTITNTSMLNKLGDKELSLDLLGDLKSNGTTVIEKSDIIDNINKELEEKKQEKDDKDEIDKSFFTKSFDLKDSLKYLDSNDEDDEEKSSKPIVIAIAIVAIIIVGIALYLVIKK